MDVTCRSGEDNSSATRPVSSHAREGAYAWVIATATAIMASLGSATVAGYGIFLPEYVDSFNISKTYTALIPAMGMGVASVFGVISGALTKRYGYQNIAISSALLATASYFISSFINILPVFHITHGILPGLAIVLSDNSCTVAIVTYFEQRKALALALQAGGLSMGIVVWAPITRWLIDCYGRNGAMLLLSGIQMQGLVTAFLLRPPSPSTSKVAPIQRIMKPVMPKPENRKMLKTFYVFRNVKYVTYLACFLLLTAGYIVPFIFIPARLQSLGYNADKGATLLSLLGITGMIARPASGAIGDILGSKRTLFFWATGVVSGTAMAVSLFFNTYITLLSFCCVFGLVSGGYMGLNHTILSDSLPRKQFAAANGFKITLCGIVIAASSVFSGWLVDVTFTYSTPFLVFGIIQILGGLLGILAFIVQTKLPMKKDLYILKYETRHQEDPCPQT